MKFDTVKKTIMNKMILICICKIHGDVVMADSGFDITEDLALRGTTLCIPPLANHNFPKGK